MSKHYPSHSSTKQPSSLQTGASAQPGSGARQGGDLSAQPKTQSPYARLFAIPGVKAFSLSGALARLPMSMMSLGIVLALNHMYNNWTIAGTMSAVYILAVAAVTPFYARLFDRFGQRKVGGPALAGSVIMMLVFSFAALAKVPIAVLFVLAILMGFTQFSFGALVRTRWAYALRGQKDGTLLNAAYALESGIDEMVFILGPILAAFLATSVHPVSQLFVPAVACAIGGTVFFSLKNTQPPVLESVSVQARTAGGAAEFSNQKGCSDTSDAPSLEQLHGTAKPKSVLRYAGVIPLLAVFVIFNMSFNEFDVSVTAMMKAMGREQLLGLQLAMFALGSCIGAFAFGSAKLKGSNWKRMVVFTALLSLGYVLCRLSMDNLLLLGLCSVLSGLCVSPIFATGNLIIKDIVPSSSLTEGLSWVSTAGSVGGSFGSTLAGMVLDAYSPHVGLLMPIVTTLGAMLLAILGLLLARRRTR